jgi:DNA-binding NtrC family response regulator/tetratricopeptide (TPR) repeat protein
MPLDGLRGESRPMVVLRTQVAQLLARQTGARRPPPVLLLGETGTGKGLLARSVHEAGPRRDGAFVAVNCAAIPETLLETELFGYARGAFTDARQAKPGLFQTADGGTLFLDEIGLLPAALQGKLLTALEDQAVRRVGSTRAESINVALIAATSVDLKRAVSERRFREDLYHRLAVITLELPPLRDRGGDILVLAEHFLARACVDYGLSPRVLTAEARDVLTRHRWPGNVRELANAMERVALLSDTDEIGAPMLGFLGGGAAIVGEPVQGAGAVAAGHTGPLKDAIRARIEAALGEHEGNIRRTAAALGISRNTLRSRMDKYGLRPAPPSRALIARTASEPPVSVDPPAPLHWERRHLAFLRARILPSSTVDTARALELIGEKVRSFGGRIEELSPTGVVAVFGLEPVDNAPSLAALAALAMQNAAGRARALAADKADIVVGIHGDDHVVGLHNAALQIGVDGKAATWSALEALVADDAGPAVFVTTAVVPFLSRRFVIQRGRAAEREVLRLLRRDDGAAWSATQFVGRDAELEQVRRALERTAEGHGQVVAIVGEPGVGKSRLVMETTRARWTDGWLILHTAAVPYGKSTPYLPVIDLLKGYFNVQDRDDLQDVREKVTNRVLALDPALEPTVPAILALLDIPVDDARWQALDPPERRQRMLDAVRRLLVRESEERPVLIIVEDLNWLDGETQALLDRLVEGLPSVAVMVLVNYRPEYQHRWGTKTYYLQLQLAPLSPVSAEDLLHQLVGDDPALASLKRMLIGRTDGNPFFLEECVRMMVETGVLAGERGAYRLGVAPPSMQVPATVRAVLGARVDRLAPPEKRLLQAAAVIGRGVPLAQLRAIADLPDDDLARCLSNLQAAELLDETRVFPDPEYTFKHPLIHEVAYDSLLPDRRRALHARIVEAIEQLHSQRLTEQFERLAHHASEGQLWEKALQYLRRAGAKALARSAYREAAESFRAALTALSHLPASRDMVEKGIDVRIRLYWALYPVGDYGSLLSYLEDAETLAKTLGDQRRLGTVSALLAQFFVTVTRHDRALEYGERALAIGTASDDLTLQLQANFSLGQAYHLLGEYHRARDSFAKNLDVPPTDLTGTIFSILSCAWSASSLAELGEFSDGMARAERALDAAEALGDHFDLINALGTAGTVCLLRGDLPQGIPRLERCLALLQAAQNESAGVVAGAYLGHAYALSGRLGDALILLERSTEQAAKYMTFGYSLSLTFLGQAYWQCRRIGPALERAHLALDLARERRERGHEAYALKLVGEIASDPESLDEENAQRYYREAITLAAELGMRPLVAHCHLGLGRLYRRTGKHEHAEDHIRTATAMYREMGMTYWLERAQVEPGN